MGRDRKCDDCIVGGELLQGEICSIFAKDNLPALCVGRWAEEKAERVRKYVDITRAVRRKFIHGPGGATYIDLFAGPGKGRIKNSKKVIDGCFLAAMNSAKQSDTLFTDVHLGDKSGEWLRAAQQRMATFEARVEYHQGTAHHTACEVKERLNPDGYNFVMLDPYNLGTLDFSIFQALGTLKRVDFLVHVSLMDLKRNLFYYELSPDSSLDSFAPGWWTHIEKFTTPPEKRRRILNHWELLLKGLGLFVAKGELVLGGKNQVLYLLAFASKHSIAQDFWDSIKNVSRQHRLLFG